MESASYEEDVMERVIPTENVQLMFHYKNPFVVYHSDNSILRQPQSIISGLSKTFSDVSTDGESGVVFVKFSSTGACHFFNFPLSEIANQSLDMSDIIGSKIKQIEETLYYTNSINEKVSVIENFLTRQYSPIPAYDSILLQKGIDIIKNHKGQINAASLSESLCVTTKSLERKFSKYLGQTTKQIIKLMHFQEVLLDFSTRKNISLTERAYNNGYFDQAHFIRDFKAFSGFTPKEFTVRYPDFDYSSEYC
jgi:AraC-like DNA-binding protein